jgi:histidinol dehydrogenase
VVRWLDDRSPHFRAEFEALVAQKREQPAKVQDEVAAILARVATDGDAALIDYTAQFDRLRLDVFGLRVPDAALDEALDRCGPDLRAALELAVERIGSFHRRQMPDDLLYHDALGTRLGLRWRPVDSVGLYVPGGTAAYPSSVLMNALPAAIAGVPRLVMTVPAPDGALNPLVLAAARLTGVHEVYRIGGAQAIAALAFGTESIAPVDKITGPGNAYVAEAKRQVFGRVGIDMIAGPSEIVVVADRDQDPGWIAADLLSQAEHDESAQAVLITDGEAQAIAVETAVEAQLSDLPRRAIAAASWRDFGAIILVQDLASVPTLVDRLAPEHLELMLTEPDAMAARIRHAGSIFLGPVTPEVIGDYLGGPNHVLPTGRSARFASGLSVFDFLKRTTLLGCTREGFIELAEAAEALAEAEGLSGHARAIALRRNGR